MRTRPCTYERRIHEKRGEAMSEVWEHADRRPYAETKLRARAFVSAQLSMGLREGSTTAGVQGRLWSEVVRKIDTKLQSDMRAQARAIGTLSNVGDTETHQPNGGPETKLRPEDVLGHNKRRGIVLGMRVDNVLGVSHGRGWERRKRGETHNGGPATNSEAWGCWGCKRARDLRTRQTLQNMNQAK